MVHQTAPRSSHRLCLPRAGRALRSAAVLIASIGLALTPSPAVGALKRPPPVKRTYFVIFLGAEGGYESAASCLVFKTRRVCSLDGGVCGSWSHTGQGGEESGLSFEISLEEGGLPVVIAGEARVDDRLDGSSLGGAATLTAEGRSGNFALAGREVARRRCRTLAAEFNQRAAARE